MCCGRSLDEQKTQAVMCLACGHRRGRTCGLSGKWTGLHVEGVACPIGRGGELVRWWGFRWWGVPKPVRWWVWWRFGERFEGLGCGCLWGLRRLDWWLAGWVI